MGAYDCLSFLTDYGLDDGFVAACHGVAATIAPAVRVIDITHLVPPGDVRRGAAVLAQTLPYLPRGVHVAVIDPGVGTSRRGIAVRAGEHILVGPDNGVLSWAVARQGGAVAAHHLVNEELWLRPVSATFHGRDIFMPVGARLAAGADLAEVGPKVDPQSLATLPPPTVRLHATEIEGEVVSIDRFGNVQLSVPVAEMSRLGMGVGSPVGVRCGRHRLTVPFVETFAAVEPGKLVVFADSAGLVSLAVNAGHAARRLGLPPGAHVRLAAARPRRPPAEAPPG